MTPHNIRGLIATLAITGSIYIGVVDAKMRDAAMQVAALAIGGYFGAEQPFTPRPPTPPLPPTPQPTPIPPPILAPRVSPDERDQPPHA